MRIVFALALCSVLALPVSAQDLVRPAGWMTRFDHEGMSEADLDMFAEMPPGWHVTSGPAGIYWTASNEITGDFRLEMEVFQFDPEGRREAFGLFLGGRDLQGPNQEYTYFLLRDGGQFLIKRREGTETPTHKPWTDHDAIRSYADRGGEASIKNVLMVEARSEDIRFFVNGSEVARLPRSELNVDGVFGFRVNHALNLHISRLEASAIR